MNLDYILPVRLQLCARIVVTFCSGVLTKLRISEWVTFERGVKCCSIESKEISTHWGWMTHICISKLTIIGSDNGLAPGRRQAIIWTDAGILSIGSLGTNFSEILITIHTFSFKKIYLNMSSGKWRPFCLGFNVLTCWRSNMFRSKTAFWRKMTHRYWIMECVIQNANKFYPMCKSGHSLNIMAGLYLVWNSIWQRA